MKNLILIAAVGLGLWLGLRVLDETLTTPDGTSGVVRAPKFVTEYEAALASASESGKPVVVVFSASWCPPCRQMKERVYPSGEVAPYKTRFVWAYLDMDKRANQEAARRHGVRGIPHIQFLDSQGRDIGKVVGGRDPASFANELRNALAKSN